MAAKRGRMVVYLDGLLPIVTCQFGQKVLKNKMTNYDHYIALPQHLGPSNLAGS